MTERECPVDGRPCDVGVCADECRKWSDHAALLTASHLGPAGLDLLHEHQPPSRPPRPRT